MPHSSHGRIDLHFFSSQSREQLALQDYRDWLVHCTVCLYSPAFAWTRWA